MRQYLLIFFLFSASFSFVAGEKIVIANNGCADYDILLSINADECEMFASQELKKYLSQMTNVKFETQQHQTKKKSIVVSNLKNLNDWKVIIDRTKLAEEAYCIFEKKDAIYLVGNNSTSTLFAVYDFLNKLGCQWLAPDFAFFSGSGQFVPVKNKLIFDYKGETKETPAFKYRKFHVEEGRTHTIENLKQLIDWMPKVRMNTLVFPINYEGKGTVRWELWKEQLLPELKKRGITIEVGGHGYQNFINASMDNGNLHKKHLEWFGMNVFGERSTDPHAVFCTSNEEAVSYLYKNILNYLKSNSEIGIFDLWPPDSETWCCCDKCKLLGNESARHIMLVNQIASLLEEDFPKVKLECLAYNRYTAPVLEQTLNKNVLLDFCPIHQSFEYQLYDSGNLQNDAYWKSLVDWTNVFKGDISLYSYYRKYAWRSLPNIIPHYMQKDMARFWQIGIKGISVYSEPGDWFTYGVNHYVFSHLAWNPNTDVDVLIKEYAVLLFGEAAETVFFIFQELEDIVRYGCNVRHSTLKSKNEYVDYFNRISVCRMELEKQSDKINNEVVNKNIHKLNLMLEYAGKSILYMQQKTANEKNTDAEIRAFLRVHANKGVFIPHKEN